MEHLKKHPKKYIPHSEIVDWVVAKYKKRTVKVFRDHCSQLDKTINKI